MWVQLRIHQQTCLLYTSNTYNYFLGDFPGHKNYDRDVLVVCDEPEKENSVNQLSEYFETIWNQEDSGYFHNNKKLANRKSVKNAVLELSLIHIFIKPKQIAALRNQLNDGPINQIQMLSLIHI